MLNRGVDRSRHVVFRVEIADDPDPKPKHCFS
jgi:hypothetical protein